MSLKFRNSQGIETPVAGLNGTSGELVPSVALKQSGTKTSDATSWASGESGTFTVTLSTAMPDADYVVNVTLDNTAFGYYVHTKTTTSFRVTVTNNSSSTYASAVTLTWTAFKLMTDTVHEADAAHISQNTANFAPAFSEVTSYAVGDYVIYNNVLYRCTTAHTAGVWVAGHFTAVTVGGDITAINSKIPSTASSTEKLAYVEYSPSTSLYSTWEELLELLHQKGAGYWTGFIYIEKWYIYTARITVGTSEYWYGSFLAKCAETEELVGASKIYGAGNTWTVTHYVTESDLAIKKKDISATGGATSFSATIPLSMAQRNKPFYLEVLSVGNNNAIKEMKYLVFVSSMTTTVTTKEISKDVNFTNVSITFNESTGYELSFSSTDTLYYTTVYTQQ